MDYTNIIMGVLGLALAIATFFFGRQSIAKKEGEDDGKKATRIEVLAEHFETIQGSHDDLLLRVNAIEITHARSEQDAVELRRMIDRIDNTKASKEVVDGFRTEVSGLRADMDKRFDRIERLIEGKKIS